MLAIRGGRSVGDLVTGASVTALGRRALLVDGVVALLVHLALARAWAGEPRPSVSR